MSINDDDQKINSPRKWEYFNRTIRNPTISPAAKGLYSLLWSYADKEGVCWPGIDTLAQQMGCDTRTVNRLLAHLVNSGAVIRKRRGKGLTNVYFLGDATNLSYYPKSDATNLSGGMRQICPSDATNLSLENDLPAYSPNGCGARNRPYNIPIEHTNILNLKATVVAEGKKKSSSKKNSAKEKTVDIRVNPTLRKFYEAFKANIGAEPPKTAFDWGRDGRRVKELPADYTEGVLAEAIERFFSAPAYVRKNYRFADFLAALPRLIKNDFQEGGKKHGTNWRYFEPSEHFD